MKQDLKLIDLSVTLENDSHWTPWWARNKVKYQNHKFGSLAIRLLFRLSPKYLKTGMGWANDEIRISTHGTTHLDAPWHYAPVSEGKKARTIDQIPLEWCFSDGVVLDMRHKKDGEAIEIEDMKKELDRIKYEIKPMDIVLIMTGNDRMIGRPEYFHKGTGMSAVATRWILDHGVKITGIDSWGWDVPLPLQAKKAKELGKKDHFWEAHYVGIEKEYCHLERLANLGALPPFGFKVCCFPMKVKNGSAGPSRVVAMIDEGNNN